MALKVVLDYWDIISRTKVGSEIKRQETITSIGDDDISIFEAFYKLNNQLRYCNGAYYTFQDPIWKEKYDAWLKSDDYKQKSFNLYYGGGVVD
jgi:hypothetical protein